MTVYYYKWLDRKTGVSRLYRIYRRSHVEFLRSLERWREQDRDFLRDYIEVPESCARNIFGNDAIDRMLTFDCIDWPKDE
jgi:hypothetical protein